jgi:heme exporter protein A
MTAEPPVLRASGVALWRGDRCLFESLSFALAAGRIALLVGANGVGKTTLLRVLAGLAPPSAGVVTWDGVPVASLPVERRGAIAYRGHLDGLKKDLTVAENLEFHSGFAGAREDWRAALRDLDLASAFDTRVRHLSAGQRRRTALAALKASAAKLWILDEPMTNLDAAGRATILRWTREHLAHGGSAVVATHQPEELAAPGALVIEL